MWTLPGGGTKGSETDKVCAARELKEELGITVDPVGLRELGEYSNKSAGYSYTVAMFSLACDKGRKIKKGLELSDMKWFPVNKLPNHRTPLVNEAISRLKQG
jgi:8-oxo-dGTP diphosphatase